MLQGVAINFVAFSRHHGNLHGQVFTLFIIAVAACEAGIALALFLMLYRRKRSLDVSALAGPARAGPSRRRPTRTRCRRRRRRPRSPTCRRPGSSRPAGRSRPYA